MFFFQSPSAAFYTAELFVSMRITHVSRQGKVMLAAHFFSSYLEIDNFAYSRHGHRRVECCSERVSTMLAVVGKYGIKRITELAELRPNATVKFPHILSEL
jgi:hypothetical protein